MKLFLIVQARNHIIGYRFTFGILYIVLVQIQSFGLDNKIIFLSTSLNNEYINTRDLVTIVTELPMMKLFQNKICLTIKCKFP